MRKVTKTLRDLLDNVWSEMNGMREELQEWADSMPQTLQGGSKYQEIEEAIERIGVVSSVECPTKYETMEVTWSERTSVRKSRAERRDDCTTALLAAIYALRRKEMAENADFVRDLESVVEEYDEVDFPGMH